MTNPPENCPICNTPIPAGRNQCIACGKVIGEDNRCPHCHGLAGVVPKNGAYACAACGRPRSKLPRTVVLAGGLSGPAGTSSTVVKRGGSIGLRLFGVLSVAAGVFFSALSGLLLPGLIGTGWALTIAGAFGVMGVGFGALLLRAGSKLSGSADRDIEQARRRSIVELATRRDGILTVAAAAEALGLSAKDAEAVLTSMVDGTSVTLEITEEGELQYWFRELMRDATAAPRVRVQTAEEELERRTG